MAAGRPTKYKKKFHNPDFIRLSKQGKNFKQIAARWDVMRSTLYEWGEKYPEFSDTMKKGRELCEIWWEELGQAAMLDQAKVTENGERKKVKVNLGFYQFLTGNMFDWSKRIKKDVEHSGEISRPGEKSDEELIARREALKDKIREEIKKESE